MRHTAVLFFLLASLFAVSACDTNPSKGSPKATVSDPVATTVAPPSVDATTFSFSNEGSQIAFVGAKVTGKHNGGFGKFTGTLTMTRDRTASGVSVDIETSSLFADQAKLTAHLKSADFFDVEKFPKATFVSTRIDMGANRGSPRTVTGNLTLHGVTKSISFPAHIHFRDQDSAIEATAEFGINRKDFGIAYAGKADDLIKDEVLIKLAIRAKK